MKNLYKILASSIAIFAFCACSQEEMPVNQSDNNQSEVVTVRPQVLKTSFILK